MNGQWAARWQTHQALKWAFIEHLSIGPITTGCERKTQLSRGRWESEALRCLTVGSTMFSSSSINIRGRRTWLQLCTQWRTHSSGRTRRTLVLSCGLCSILMYDVQSWQKGWNSILKLVACVFSNIKPKRSTQGMVTDSDFLRLRNVVCWRKTEGTRSRHGRHN